MWMWDMWDVWEREKRNCREDKRVVASVVWTEKLGQHQPGMHLEA